MLAAEAMHVDYELTSGACRNDTMLQCPMCSNILEQTGVKETGLQSPCHMTDMV